MPELPEVQTTVNGINRVAVGHTITDVWTDLAVPEPKLAHHKQSTKSASFFTFFREHTIGSTIVNAERRAKNIFIHLSNNYTIQIHMKMTGHLMYGSYTHNKKTNIWNVAENERNDALRDRFNAYLHTVFTIQNPDTKEIKQLVLSDVRKFANVTLFPTEQYQQRISALKLGPEPLETSFTESVYLQQINKKPTTGIKLALLDQSIIAGIGNIYSDEALWLAGIHPLRKVSSLASSEHHLLFTAIITVLQKGIMFGGDSTSDYRDIDGKPGNFQGKHEAYRRTGSACGKKGCTGIITRIAFHGRGAHFCTTHQI